MIKIYKQKEENKKEYRKRSFGVSVAGFLLIALIIVCLLQNTTFALIGDPIIDIEVGEDYLEQGATANVGNNNVSDSINIDSSNVDTSTPGSYNVVYNITNQYGGTTTIIREVNVVDTKPPEIVLIGNNPLSIIKGDTYFELGAYAFDNVYGDISNNITILRNCWYKHNRNIYPYL